MKIKLLLLLLCFSAFAKAQNNFDTPVVNPFGIVPSGPAPLKPEFVDLDADGDLDILTGAFNGSFYYYENTGNATAPAYGASITNPFGLQDTAQDSTVSMADIDGDGDFDLITGNLNNGFLLFNRNIGTATNPMFGNFSNNPWGLSASGPQSEPTWVDLDNDSDYDLLVGNTQGDWFYFENVGTSTAPSYGPRQTNPLALINDGGRNTPDFIDFDADGDLDLFVGRQNNGSIVYYENTGTVSAPNFPGRISNPFGYSGNFSQTTPELADIDNDGDIDLLLGNSQNNFRFFENTLFSGGCTVNIPDANFKAALVGNAAINTNGDTEIQCAEASAYTGTIAAANQNVADLTGIEAFTQATSLQVFSNNLTSLDLSQNLSLVAVLAEQNNITGSVDLSMLTQLADLKIHSNNVLELNVANGNNSNFTRFEAQINGNLSCIQIDTGFTPPGFWLKDVGTGFSNNCANQAPTAVCQPFTAQLDVNGNVTILATDVDGGSSDPEGALTYAIDQDTFTCADVGANTVTLTVTDSDGVTDTCTATVTVEDNTAPVVTVPSNIIVANDLGNCSAFVNLTIGNSDACGLDAANTSNDIPAGFIFPVGITTVTVTATDVNGNVTTETFTVTVNDTETPVINTPANITVSNDTGTCAATVTFGLNATDNCGTPTVTSDIATGSTFSVGTTTVTLTADDGNGNITTDTFTVTVNDTEAPTITCPANQTIMVAQGTQYTLPDYLADGDAIAMDNCTFTTLQTPVAGTMLSVGTYTIDFEVTDASGNTEVCDFELIVDEILGTNNTALASFKLFPNPAITQITIKGNFDIATIEIYNLLGQKVLSSTSEILNIQELSSAIYLLTITDIEGNKATKRFIKK